MSLFLHIASYCATFIFQTRPSRFTYALDKLSYEVPEGIDNPLFVVAVGNDGELPPTFNRIQAPSDIVNGLGIGAYTYDANGKKVPTSYSCVGPGREGAKTKPDLLDFGGSVDHPFIVPSLNHVSVCATAGTSFAAPLVTGKIGRLIATSEQVSPHMGRTLLIHNAEIDESLPKCSQGFGFSPENVANILECTDKCVTIMYSGLIMPTGVVKNGLVRKRKDLTLWPQMDAMRPGEALRQKSFFGTPGAAGRR